jgi:hypothetical protein
MNSLFNLTDYTPIQHVFFAVGCLLWVFTYIGVIRNLKKNAFIEIPLIAVTANFAWELLWSFYFITNMGNLYVWGYRIWFFLDCFIVYGLWKNGYKQLETVLEQSYAKLIIVLSFACWIPLLFFYIKNYDYPVSHNGLYSGYILNVMMSGIFISFYLRNSTNRPFITLSGAWLKGLGTFFISICCFLKYDDWFLLSMCLVNTILDGVYIYLIYRLRKNGS